MEKQTQRANEIHILMVPLPVQGHINPILQFFKRLANKGLRVTLVTISTTPETIPTEVCKVRIEPISAKSEDVNVENQLLMLQTILSQKLPELIKEQDTNGCPISCLVYDSAMTWLLEMAKGLGILGASFFTQSCAVGTVYFNVHQGLLRVRLEEGAVSLPGLPLLEAQDLLPSFICDPGCYPALSKMVVGRFSNINSADWIFFNTFDCLEK